MSNQSNCQCRNCECGTPVVEKQAASGGCQCASSCGCGENCLCTKDARCSDACYCV